MIVTELYNGQGLGNQLWSYVVTRTLALDRSLDFGIMSPEKFKGKAFLDIDFGKEVKGGSGRRVALLLLCPKVSLTTTLKKTRGTRNITVILETTIRDYCL